MSPTEPLEDTTTYSQWLQITENQQPEKTVPKTSTNPQISVPIIEAQGWLVDKKGKIHLVAHINNTNSNNPSLFFPPPSSCPSSLPYGKTSGLRGS